MDEYLPIHTTESPEFNALAATCILIHSPLIS